MMHRFKIDYSDRGGRYIFGLFHAVKGGWFRRGGWEEIDHFERREEAMALYEKIKDLPEYLN